jgi:molybdenum cofactor cytidylyltransferase
MTAERSAAVAGILLAAGSSRRMGRNKLHLEWEGQSLLRLAATRALAGGLSPLLVVLGHEAERTASLLAGLPHRAVLNERHALGINSSLACGLAAVPATAAAAVVVLGDMPFVTAEMIAALLARYRATAAPLVVSDYDGVNAPPILYDRALFGELMAMTTSGCGKQVLERHRGAAEVLRWPVAALTDLDVLEDYEQARGGGASRP